MLKIKYDDQRTQPIKNYIAHYPPPPPPLKNWVHLCSLFKLLEKPSIFVPFISTLRGAQILCNFFF